MEERVVLMEAVTVQVATMAIDASGLWKMRVTTTSVSTELSVLSMRRQQGETAIYWFVKHA